MESEATKKTKEITSEGSKNKGPAVKDLRGGFPDTSMNKAQEGEKKD